MSFLIFITHPSVSYSLERDYAYSGGYIGDGRYPEDEDEDGTYIYYYDSDELCYYHINEACFCCIPAGYRKEVDINTIPSVVEGGYGECAACYDRAVYSGYLHFRYKEDYPFLKRQIEYSKKYPQYQSYWPETSVKAEKISDIAVILFEDLIDKTALKKIKNKSNLSNNFITDSWYFERLGSFTLPRSLSACCFRFTDFYIVCKDLEHFSSAYFSDKETALIQEKTCAILDRLSGMFLEMYNESLALHPTAEIQNEINFISLLYANDRDIKIGKGNGRVERAKHSSSYLLNKFYESRPSQESEVKVVSGKQAPLPCWLIGDYWFYEGIRCNDLFLYSDAVTYLTAAIEKDPNNIEAYQERAHAYFELGNLELAIEDYKVAKQSLLNKKGKIIITGQTEYYFCDGENDQESYVINPEPKGMMDFSGGFCVGISKGGSDSLVEFVPSTWSCCKGILHGVWCFACSPKEVSGDVINTSYELVKFIKENTARECLEVVVPELKELCLNWDSLSDYDRGSKTGYIIGKYGVDILAPGAALKGIKKYQQLKRLNSMFTIECCVASQAKKAKILEASYKHSSARTIVVESVKSGKIVPRNANVIPHVMQEKHAWDKLIKISGNKTEDFARVSSLLEEAGIFSEKYLFETEKFHNGKIIRSDYIKVINGYEVQACFETYTETNQTFIKDAWVVKK